MPRAPTAFSVDRPTKRSERSPKKPDHLKFIRSLPCCVCLDRKRIEAAHIRYADPLFKKPGTAMAQKPDDKWTVPLCDQDHRVGPNAQHNSNERDWWNNKRINPVALAINLYAMSGDVEAGIKAIIALSRVVKTRR